MLLSRTLSQQKTQTRAGSVAVYIFWDGILVDLEASIHPKGDDMAEVHLRPVPRYPLPLGAESFEEALKQMGFRPGPGEVGRQQREWMKAIWNVRGALDAVSAQSAFENVVPPTKEAIIQSILRRSK